jgi:hypothetical protein
MIGLVDVARWTQRRYSPESSTIIVKPAGPLRTFSHLSSRGLRAEHAQSAVYKRGTA